MLPFVLLGLFTYIISIIFNLPGLLLLSIFNMGGSAGDIVTFIFISKLKNIEFTELDDESSFAIYSSNDISKIKHFGLKYIGCQNNVERKKLKKITISKCSIIIIILLIVLGLIDFL